MQDDHASRKCCYSTVYYFSNPPSKAYTAAATILKNLPICKICCQSKASMGSTIADFLVDRKPNPVEGQSYHFPTKDAKVSTAKAGGKKETTPKKLGGLFDTTRVVVSE